MGGSVCIAKSLRRRSSRRPRPGPSWPLDGRIRRGVRAAAGSPSIRQTSFRQLATTPMVLGSGSSSSARPREPTSPAWGTNVARHRLVGRSKPARGSSGMSCNEVGRTTSRASGGASGNLVLGAGAAGGGSAANPLPNKAASARAGFGTPMTPIPALRVTPRTKPRRGTTAASACAGRSNRQPTTTRLCPSDALPPDTALRIAIVVLMRCQSRHCHDAFGGCSQRDRAGRSSLGTMPPKHRATVPGRVGPVVVHRVGDPSWSMPIQRCPARQSWHREITNASLSGFASILDGRGGSRPRKVTEIALPSDSVF